MPILTNPRHEAFARARAGGARLIDAYEGAGFGPDRSHAARLAGQDAVAERIAELIATRAEAADAGPGATIAALLRLAKACEELETPAGLKEARLMLMEARRIAVEQASDRHRERLDQPVIPL